MAIVVFLRQPTAGAKPIFAPEEDQFMVMPPSTLRI
jgi:hypothetical protein